MDILERGGGNWEREKNKFERVLKERGTRCRALDPQCRKLRMAISAWIRVYFANQLRLNPAQKKSGQGERIYIYCPPQRRKEIET
jgi:hypothetical protein